MDRSPETFVAFDVETPNAQNSRMSAIGIAVVRGGRVAEEFSTLVNPETGFDAFNISLTGITPAQAAAAPSFPQLWPRLRGYLEQGTLLAHNAPFDLAVLGKCLRAYEIDWRPTVPYACTVRMSRACLPALPSHRLDALCRYFGIPLDHHRAGSDSRACAEIFLRCLDLGADLTRFRRTYELERLRTVRG